MRPVALLPTGLLVIAALAGASERPDTAPPPRTLGQTLPLRSQGATLHFPADWTVAPTRFANASILTTLPARRGGTEKPARIMVTWEERTSHDDAVERLAQIAAEVPSTPTFLVAGGWPALQRRDLAPRPKPGEPEGGDASDEMVLRITTAIAADRLLLRLEGSVPPERAGELAAEVEAIGRATTFAVRGDPAKVAAEVRRLRRRARPSLVPDEPARRESETSTRSDARPEPALAVGREKPADLSDATGAALRAQAGGSEISVAVSSNGQNVVVGTNSGFSVSSDGGTTFSAKRFPTGFPAGYGTDGDPSLAVGASGNFYYALIDFPPGGNGTAMNVSSDGGQSFAYRSNAVLCVNDTNPPSIPGACFADQEHIAADRFNAGPTGGDQVYSTWRNFDATDQDPAIVCTSDSASTWSAPLNVGSGFKPRINVGQDGFVYVIYLSGGNVMLHKFSSCASGLAPQAGFPKLVATINEVSCPVPGLDRCTGRNTLASYTVAVDDTNASHVYAAFATNTSPGVNENVLVRDSLDGGATWPGGRVVQLNAAVNGRRFMPWLCTVGGTAHVTWYDRRAATPGSNDLTDFYRGTAALDGSSNLVAGTEVKLTQLADPHCASGWPCATDRIGDSESCSVQPQPGGVCAIVPTPNPDTSSKARCDFSDCGVCSAGLCVGTATACASDADCTRDPSCACAAGESCVVGRGCPKYGDYNYSACAAGRIYGAWASATTPPSLPPAPARRIDTYISIDLVCCVPRIDAPASITLPDTCAGSTGSAPLNVCNTGFTDLVVSGITSTSAQFSVPASYPVTIAASACHAFSAHFTPASHGPKTANLTVNSNDPVTPAKVVAASGQGKGLETIACPAGITVGNDPGLCSAAVNPGTPTVNADGCAVTVAGVRGDGHALTDPYPVGTTHITWTVTDGGGNALSCGQTIVVNDVEPPVITGAAPVPASLWPPNHKMAPVAVNYDVTDNCDPLPAIACGLAVTSNEPVNGTGDGDTAPDWQVLDSHHELLRAERAGGGSGRVYTTALTCSDSKGNTSGTSVAVTVPHDRH